jgi:methylenetetrahydrofolate dehydrogenase (NADP+)/methenyltetrahydrofolate cyclohydrolase
MISLTAEPILDQLDAVHRTWADELIAAGTDPHLAVIQLGEDPSSTAYIKQKGKRLRFFGAMLSLYQMPEATPLEDVLGVIAYLAADDDVHGIIIQLPLPESWTSEMITQLLRAIPHTKDVDGLAEAWDPALVMPTLEAHIANRSVMMPPMIGSVVSLLDHYKVIAPSDEMVVVGTGRLVGQPLARYFAAHGYMITAVDEETPLILDLTTKADILISGTGVADTITYQWVKEGAVVLNTAADVHVDSVNQVARALSPEKGGIGPLTVAWLTHNVLIAASNQSRS